MWPVSGDSCGVVVARTFCLTASNTVPAETTQWLIRGMPSVGGIPEQREWGVSDATHMAVVQFHCLCMHPMSTKQKINGICCKFSHDVSLVFICRLFLYSVIFGMVLERWVGCLSMTIEIRLHYDVSLEKRLWLSATKGLNSLSMKHRQIPRRFLSQVENPSSTSDFGAPRWHQCTIRRSHPNEKSYSGPDLLAVHL